MGGTTSQNTCQTSTIAIPAINVANAVWNGPDAGTTPMNWSLNISDPTGNISNPVTGTGNMTPVAASTPAAPAVGCHIIKLNSIALTVTGPPPAAPTHPFCSTTITGQQKHSMFTLIL